MKREKVALGLVPWREKLETLVDIGEIKWHFDGFDAREGIIGRSASLVEVKMH